MADDEKRAAAAPAEKAAETPANEQKQVVKRKVEKVSLTSGDILLVECPKCTYEFTLNDRGVPSGRRVVTKEGDQ